MRRRICRLCLITSQNYQAIIGNIKNILDKMPLKVNLAVSEEPVMCTDCAKKLISGTDFMAKSIDTHQYIVSFFNSNSNGNDKVDLKKVYLSKHQNVVSIPEDHMVCGFCMGLIKTSSAIYLDHDIGEDVMIEKCLPELDLSIIATPIICAPCQQSLGSCIRFVKDCLMVEKEIQQHCKAEGEGPIELTGLQDMLNGIIKDGDEEFDHKDERLMAARLQILNSTEQFRLHDTSNCETEEDKADLVDIGSIYVERNEIKHENDDFAMLDDQKLLFNEDEGLMEVQNQKFYDIQQFTPQQEDIKFLNVEEIEIKPDPGDFGSYQEKDALPQPKAIELQQMRGTRELQKHNKLTHRSDRERTVYHCESCSFKTNHKSSLQRHMLIHKAPTEISVTAPLSDFSLVSGNMEVNKLDNIINKQLSDQDKINIKNIGPPQPNLTISKVDKKNGREFTRHFTSALYKYASWLCGCETRSAFFCFVCVLIKPNGAEEAWTRKGITDIKHLVEKVKRHKMCDSHLHSEIEFALLGSVNTRFQLSSAYRRSIKEHNEKVKENLHILNKIIDCVKFCGAFELAVRGHDESSNSEDPGIFRGILNLVSEVDAVLKDHLKSNSTFMGISETIQTEILDAILYVCRKIIKNNIKKANYLAIQADEITDSSNRQHMTIILRYVLEGEIYERFWGFFAPENYTENGLSATILEQLKILEINETPEKLISQSYDGATVTSGKNSGGVQAKVKNAYQGAYCIHCYAHQLNLIVTRAVSQHQKLKVFFANLESFSTYFSRSTKRTSIFNDIVSKRIPSAPTTRWDYNIKAVTTVYAYRHELEECFQEIIEKETDTSLISKTCGMKMILNDPDFLYWLELFSKIMPHVEILHNQLQRKKIDLAKFKICLCDFKQYMQNIRDGICVPTNLPTSSKRRRIEDNNVMVAKEVCDIIVSCVEDRFGFNDHLATDFLLCPENFYDYRNNFPNSAFHSVNKAFPFLDSVKLKHELTVLYSREEFITLSGALPLLQILEENNLTDAFSEVVKLLKIACTIPMTTAESERRFSTLKRVKTFLSSTTSCGPLCALAMLSMEKNMITSINNFNDQVVEVFVRQKERRAEFVYKTIA